MPDTRRLEMEAMLQRMRQEFIGKLPQRLADLQEPLRALQRGEAGALTTLHRLAHSLVGAAGVHQLLPVSEAARVLERAAVPQDGAASLTSEGMQALQQAMQRLEQVITAPSPHASPVSQPKVAELRIMVVDDDPAQVAWLRTVLQGAGYQVDAYTSLAAFRAACDESSPLPAAIIMDMAFPEGGDAGARAIEDLKARCLNGLPVIFVSVQKDMASRLAAYRAGATRYLTKPLDREALLNALGQATATTPDQPYRVLLVEDDPDQLAVYAQILRAAGMVVHTAQNPLQVPELLQDFAAEVLVLDMYMPQCNGPELAAVLNDDPKTAPIPIVYLSAETNISLQLLALDRGGDHFLTKPVEPRHLVMATRLHARRFRSMSEQTLALQESFYERQRQQIAMDAHAIVSVADTDGNIRFANDKFCQISGYTREQLIGQNHRIVKSDEHPPEFYRDMWQTISAGKIWQGEVCNRSRLGQRYWVETTIVPFLDSAGLPYQYISVRTDVTQVKAAEIRLQKIVSRVPGMVFQFRMDAQGWISFPFLSEGAREVLGVEPGLARQDARTSFRLVLPEDQEGLQASILSSGQNLTHWRHEFRVQSTHGDLRWLSGDAVPEREADGAVLWHGFIADASERKQQEVALKEALQATEKASLAKSEFLASMSHELRTPLNAILGFSQIFGMDPALPQETRGYAKEIENAGNHLLSLVNGLIDLARIESGQLEMSPEWVDLAAVLNESLSMIAPLATRQSLTLSNDTQVCTGLRVYADYVRLRQIVINLLSNAIKYNRPQGSVRLLCNRQGERVRISVVDTGRGIARDSQNRIFNAFDRLGAERGNIEGTGIGLVLTKRMVEAMHGRIGFDSVEGQGSTFWFELDAKVVSVPAPAALAAGAPPGGATATPPALAAAPRKVVLYIEDNPMNLRLMHQVFARRKDLELRDAHTAELGVELALASPPALILMDINLPGMDGYQALARLQADARMAGVPVLAVTANAMKGEEQRALAAGFSAYVAKPLDVANFMALLNRLLASPKT